MGFRKFLFPAAVCLWSAVWIWIMRYHFLDDAFINLRHAELLAEKGFITFDGINRTDGISSLLGVGIVSFLYRWIHSVFVLKLTSCVYFAGLLFLFFRKWIQSFGAARILWAALILVSISLLGLRWLTDGMETSLVLLMAALFALEVNRTLENPAISPGRYFFFFVWAALLILLRIEFAFVILVSTASVVFSRETGFSGLLRQSHWALGAAAGFLTAYFLTGEFIPDPAIAKTIGHASFFHGFRAIGAALLGGVSFGAGLVICAVLSGFSAALTAVRRRRELFSVLAVNSLLLILYLVTSLRGQEVQGIRHVLWCFYFVIVWNIGALSRLSAGEDKTLRKAFIFFCLFLAAALPFELKPFLGIIQSRSESFLAMRREPLKMLAGMPGIAFDIGTAAYFSKAKICDMMGVVNGRGAARMTSEERLERCRNESPVFVFATAKQASYVMNGVDMEDWSVCSKYTFRNLRNFQLHYLFVSPKIAGGLCPNPLGQIRSKTIVLKDGAS